MFRLFLLCLSLGFSNLGLTHEATPASSRGELVVGFYEFPPWIFTDTDGSIRGSLYESQRDIILRSGYQPRFRSLPSARLYNGLKDGSVHLWIGAEGKADIREFTLESKSRLGQTLLNLYYPAGQQPPRIPQDLVNKNIILISGYTYWPSVNQLLQDPTLQIKTHRTSTHESALKMLERQRGDYLINYAPPVTAAFKHLPEQPLEAVPLDRLTIRFIVSRKAPNAEQILQDLDSAYQRMLDEGLHPFPSQFD